MRPVLSSLLAIAAIFLGSLAAHAQAPLPAPARQALFRPVAAHAVAGQPLLPLAAGAGPGLQCRAAIAAAERAAGIPHQLMAAIGRVESGRREPDGTVNPWPWSINAEGTGYVFDTEAEAISAVQKLQAQGVRSIDVGCMQVNLMHHPDAFANLQEAFDPVANANYAARFLLQLHEETGTWPTATAWYHSATPEIGADYQRRVMAVWPEEQKQPPVAPQPQLASSYANGYANGFTGGYSNGFANGYANGFTGGPSGPVRLGGVMMTSRQPPAHVVPLAAGAIGRSLAAYRAAPIPLQARPAPALQQAGNPG